MDLLILRARGRTVSRSDGGEGTECGGVNRRAPCNPNIWDSCSNFPALVQGMLRCRTSMENVGNHRVVSAHDG